MGHCLAALAVILSFMADTKHVVLIHGSWSRGEQLAPARTAFEERGYTAHTPTLRHHELPMQEGAMKIASLSLRDYTDDLVTFVNSLDCPPLLIGHSTGGLLAQLVAARTRHAGLVAACPAPAVGILGAAGAKDIEARPIRGDPVHALFRLAKEVKADLLVVGNVGLSTRSDKWLGSVPGNVLRRAKTDVLLVHTTD
jgi:nucleotide-binding universal stress UspA family protein